MFDLKKLLPILGFQEGENVGGPMWEKLKASPPPLLRISHCSLLKMDDVFLQCVADAQECLKDSDRYRNIVSCLPGVAYQDRAVMVWLQDAIGLCGDNPHCGQIFRELEPR